MIGSLDLGEFVIHSVHVDDRLGEQDEVSLEVADVSADKAVRLGIGTDGLNIVKGYVGVAVLYAEDDLHSACACG